MPVPDENLVRSMVREAVERAQVAAARGRRTVVFVDEVHRFNKSQQDAFLPHVEAGLFTFIGATTENPSFEVNSALLSRATVQVLKSLDAEELGQLRQIERAIRTGVSADGRKLFPPMGFPYYAGIANDDMSALIAYLRSLKPTD